MMVSKRVLVAVTALLLCVFVTDSAFAARITRTRYQSKGFMASAEWLTGGGETCLSSNVNLNVSESTDNGTMLFVNIWQYNWCTATMLRSISVSSPIGPNQFVGDRNRRSLNHAILVTDVVGYDNVTATNVPLHLDLNWQGEGDIFNGMYMNRNWSRTYLFEQQGRGANRMATVSGVISDGVTDYADENGNYSSGQLYWNTYSFLSIIRP